MTTVTKKAAPAKAKRRTSDDENVVDVRVSSLLPTHPYEPFHAKVRIDRVDPLENRVDFSMLLADIPDLTGQQKGDLTFAVKDRVLRQSPEDFEDAVKEAEAEVAKAEAESRAAEAEAEAEAAKIEAEKAKAEAEIREKAAKVAENHAKEQAKEVKDSSDSHTKKDEE